MFDMENVFVQIKQLVLNLQKGEMAGGGFLHRTGMNNS